MARRPWNLEISDESRAGWHAFAAEEGVTATALIEMLGLRLGASGGAFIPKAVVRDARRLAHERRVRGDR